MITTITEAFLLAWLITGFDPLKKLINFIPEGVVKFYTQTLFGCLKCCSFWVCLILSGNIFLAAGTAFIAYWYDMRIAPKFKLN